MHTYRFFTVACVFVGLVGCSSTTDSPSPCTGDSPLAGCGNRCTDSTPCSTGLYCAESGRCGADCNYAAHTGCAAGQMCNLQGRCVAETDGTFTPTDGPGFDNTCANVELNTNHTTPNVILIIDRSSSMDEDFGSGSRWSVLRNTLMDEPDGLVSTLQASVRFGLATYNGFDGDGPMCPNLRTVTPALNNYDAIATVYTGGGLAPGTPTGEAIQAVLADPALSASTTDPTVFVLATDGEPYGCEGIEVDGRPRSLAAVQAAYTAGIRTYVLGVGDDADLDDAHLTDLANAGIGAAPSASSMFWRVNDDASLISALETIVGSAVSCDIALTNGSIDTSDAGAYCAGSSVQLNGNPLPCEDDNGWTAVDATHIRLQGTACDELIATGGSVTATFPCTVILF